MRFMTIYKPGFEAEGPPSQKEMADMGARVSITNGSFTVIDGPFAEAKEIVGGFAIIEVPSKAEAIAWTKRFLSVVGHGESEIRLMQDAPATAGPV